jgi:hypothetical protein
LTPIFSKLSSHWWTGGHLAGDRNLSILKPVFLKKRDIVRLAEWHEQ